MPTTTFYPGVSGDDGAFGNGGFDNNVAYFTFGAPGGTARHCFIRFPNVTIPAGSIITNAYLTGRAALDESGTTVYANAYFNDVDDAVAPTDNTEAGALALTAAVAWDSVAAWTAGTDYDSPDLTSILQDIIDRVGWASGQAVMVVVKDDGSTANADRSLNSIDYNGGSDPPGLYVEWSESVEVSADCVSLTLTPNAATISYDLDIQATCVSLSIAAQAAQVGFGAQVNAACVSLTITSNAAVIVHNVNLLAACASLTLTPNAASVVFLIEVDAAVVPLTIAVHNAEVTWEYIIRCTCASLTLTAPDALISYDIDVEAEAKAFTLATYDAAIWDGAAWSLWLLANYSKTVRRYLFTLTGDADGETDIEIPIKSFQCRRRSGSPSYLSVVIKDLTYTDAINARSNGDIKVDMIYELNGEVAYRNTLISVHLEDPRIDEGPLNSSITLVGYQQVASGAAKSLTMQDLVYTQFLNGQYRYRCSIPSLYLNPGDTVVDGETTFVVDEIQYIVDVLQQTMEVRGLAAEPEEPDEEEDPDVTDLLGIIVKLYAKEYIGADTELLFTARTDVSGAFSLGAIEKAYYYSYLTFSDPLGRYFASEYVLGAIDPTTDMTISVSITPSGAIAGTLNP